MKQLETVTKKVGKITIRHTIDIGRVYVPGEWIGKTVQITVVNDSK